MHPIVKRKFLGGAIALAVLAGAGGAYAVASGDRGGDAGREAFLNDVAKRLGVTPQKLDASFKAAIFERLDRQVAAGRLSKEEADAIKEHIERDGAVPGPPPGPGGPGFRGGPGFHGGPPPGPYGGPPRAGAPMPPPPPPGLQRRRGDHHPHGDRGPLRAGLKAAAEYLGLTRQELRRELRTKSLADVARARNKDVAGLKGAIEAAVKKQLDRAVANKRLTAEDERRMLSMLRDRLDEIVNQKGLARRPPRAPRPGRGGWRHP